MTRIIPKLLGSIPEMGQAFGEILLSSPEQAVLLVCGGLLVGVSVLVLGYLAVGALVRPLGGLPSPGRGQRAPDDTTPVEGYDRL